MEQETAINTVNIPACIPFEACSWWAPAMRIEFGELNNKLRAEIARLDDGQDYEAYVTAIISQPRLQPSSWFELVFNKKSGRACAIYVGDVRDDSGGFHVETTAPCWSIARDPNDAADMLFGRLVDEKSMR